MEKRRGRWTRLLAILLNLILVLENCLPVYAGGITPDTCSHADGSTVYRQISNKVHEYYCYACHQTLWYEACEPQYIAASDGSGHWAECKKCRGQMTGVMIHDKEGASKSVMVNGVSHTARSCSVCGYVSPLDAHDYEFRKETAQQAADCGAVCRLCGEESPYNKHFFLDYPWLNQPWNYNRKQHWGVCWKCGQEGKRTDHVWAERDDGKGGRERFCSTCGYNVGHPSSSHCKMHDHRYETLPESAGYHRKYCTICGMPDGAATKCTHVTLQTTDKAHTYTCSDCHQTWTEQHDFDVLRDQNAGSTDAGCKGKCNICGYVGWYPVYTYSWINNNGINTVSIGDHIWGTAVKNKHSAQDGHTHNITCVDCGFVKEENCDLTDPNGFYYKPDNSHPGQSHYKVCRKCGNGLSVADGTIENCTRYDYTQYNAYYHIRTCADCGAKWKGKGFEKHPWERDPEEDDDRYHYYKCICGETDKKLHNPGPEVAENWDYWGGTYWTYDKVRRCTVCNKVVSSTPAHKGKKSDPPKQKVKDCGAVKVRRGGGAIKRKDQWEAAGIDPNLLSAEVVAGGILEDMADNPENYLDEDFTLAAAVNTAVGNKTLPDDATAQVPATYNGQGDVINPKQGNTALILSPSVWMQIADNGYNEDTPTEITYNVGARYDVILSYNEGQENAREVVIQSEVPLDVTDPTYLSLPVPAEFLYSKSVVVEHSYGDGQKAYYLGECTGGIAANTVNFMSEKGLPLNSTFKLRMLEHKLVHVEAKAATRFAAGNIEYWACTETGTSFANNECGKRFRDILCTTEVTEQECEIAQLPETQITISFDENGGSGTMGAQPVYMGDPYRLPECGFTAPAGKKFDCWDLGFVGDSIVPLCNTTLVAQWIDESASISDNRPCTITFDKSVDADSEVIGEMEPQVFQRGVSGNFAKNQFSRPGYVFEGWSRTGSSSDYIPDMGEATFYANTVMTAVWRKLVTVNYDANGGEGSMEPQLVMKSVYTNLNKNQFTRDGYEFIGWNTDPSATTVLVDAIYNRYTDCGYVAQSESKTLYAIWKKSCKVHFDKNAEDATGEMDDQNIPKSKFTALNKNRFVRDGYEFIGWNEDPAGTRAQVKDGANCYPYEKDEITYYAVWGRKNNITFYPNGGQGEMDRQEFATYETISLNKCAYTNHGYEFYGWAKSETSTFKYYNDQATMTATTDGDLDLYALWIKPVTVHFDKNADDALGTMADQVGDSLNSIQLNANTFTREGYTFMGWSLNADALDKGYADKYAYFRTKEDVTLYAVWNRSINVHFEKNAEDATGTMSDQSAVAGKAFYLSSNKFTRDGYTFSGWALTPDATIPKYKNFACCIMTENTTLYAVWNKRVKLTFEKNGATSGTMSYQTMYDKTYTKVNANKFSRTGYTFRGWGLTPNATSIVAPDQGYAYLSEDTTWYALWKPETAAAVTEAVAGTLDTIKDLSGENLTEVEKEQATEAVDAAVDAILGLSEIDGVDVSENMIKQEATLAKLEEAVFEFGTGMVSSNKGAKLVYDTAEAPEELAGDVKVTNALLNAFICGVEDENQTAAGGEVAVTFKLGLSDNHVDHDPGNEFDKNTALTFSMKINNVAQAGKLAVPAVISMPLPARFEENLATLAIVHYDALGRVKERLTPWVIGDRAIFAVSDFSDFAFVKGNDEGKKLVAITANPIAGTITYGQTLSDSALSGGKVMAGNEEVAGTFRWMNPEISPVCADSNSTVYRVIFTPADPSYRSASCAIKVVVNKADTKVVTYPSKVSNLVADGTAKQLIKPGVATGGIMKYALGSDNTTAPTSGWSTEVPTAVEAGTYYVWYKRFGDENHKDSSALSITVEITAGGNQDPDPVNPDPVNPDPVNPDPVNPDPVNPGPVNPDPVNPDPVNPDPVNPDPVNPDPETPEEPVTPVVPEPAVTDVVHAINVMSGAVAKNSSGVEVKTARENEVISISWLKKEGYEFEKWELTGATPDNSLSENTAFRMGTEEVTVAYSEKLTVADQINEELPEDADTTTKVTALKFEKSALTLQKKAAAVANPAMVKAQGTAPEVIYVTENKDIVAVDKSGNFWPTGVGEAVVTAYCGNKKATCKVTVVSYTTDIIIRNEAEEEVNGKTLEMKGGEQAFFNVSFEPYDSTDPRNVTWKSDNKKVTVKNGMVTAKEISEAVTANITASVKVTDPATGKLSKTITQTVKIHVTPVVVEKAANDDKSHKLTVKKMLKMTANKDKDTADLAISVAAKNVAVGDIKIVSVESSNNDVVSINNVSAITADKKNGKATVTLKAQSAGIAYIVVKTSSGDGSTVNVQRCKVTVTSPATAITVKSGSLEVKENKMTMRKGENGTVVVVLTPEFSTDLGKLKISGSGGITVKNGIIYAKKISKAGKPAKLTVKCGKHKTTVEVTVTK